jgi:hypothetical protein
MGISEQRINTGTYPNDHSGDPLKVAFTKTNENFDELFLTVNAAFDKANTVTSTNTLTNGIYTVSLDDHGFLHLADTNNQFLGNTRINGGSFGPYFGDGGGVWLANSAANSFYTVMVSQAANGLGYIYTEAYNSGPQNGSTDAGILTYDSVTDQHNYWIFRYDGVTNFPARASFGETGYHIPDINNKTGEKVTLWDQYGYFNYSIGVEQDAMWFGVDTGLSSKGFSWYTGNTKIMELTRAGNLKFSDNTSQNTAFSDATYNKLNVAYDTANATTVALNNFIVSLNLNALDINAEGGTSTTIFSITDPIFTGGSSSSVFGQYEPALDGGLSFNNIHSASYIDGGSANQL